MPKILSVILMTIPAYLIVISVHELGHILTGLINGFKFYIFVIGPIGLKRNEKDDIVLYFEKNPALWGGIGGVLPKTENSKNFKSFSRLIIAGPLFSLLFGGITLLIFFVWRQSFFLIVGAMSLGIFVTTLIPYQSGAFYSDGGRWLRIIGNTKAKDVELAIFSLVQSAVIHQGYSHIETSDFLTLINNGDHREQYIGHLYAKNYYAEQKDSVLEDKHLLQLKGLESKVPKSFIKLMDQ